ncbi:hypothetical protein [Geobacter sp. AOG1]|uniref:hypothetical protein n=1 Tax=Geobacter sp. AOG1 TaxID=1566346 RepID=UPI001CC38E4E|nr:hypothetical protein [Geobacter sp. AOG1]GFE57625.1 hypothetical protein AOG1_15050 [Geobacter sp. AOG1]
MKRYRTPLILLATLVLLAVTNPGFDRHKEKIAERTREESGILSAAVGALRNEFGYLRYRNYLLCSATVTKISRPRLVSIGVLGMVVVVSTE